MRGTKIPIFCKCGAEDWKKLEANHTYAIVECKKCNQKYRIEQHELVDVIINPPKKQEEFK